MAANKTVYCSVDGDPDSASEYIDCPNIGNLIFNLRHGAGKFYKCIIETEHDLNRIINVCGIDGVRYRIGEQ